MFMYRILVSRYEVGESHRESQRDRDLFLGVFCGEVLIVFNQGRKRINYDGVLGVTCSEVFGKEPSGIEGVLPDLVPLPVASKRIA